MSYGPHPNDFLFSECKFTPYGPFYAHCQAHFEKMVSFSTKTNVKRYTLTILYSETWILLPKKNSIYSNIMGMSPFTFNRCDVFIILPMSNNPQKLPNNSLRRLLSHRNRSLYKVHGTQ